MTQYGYEPLSPEDSGSTLLERLNGVVPALLTNHKGAARPAYVEPGMMWIDDSGADWSLNMFDGSSDVHFASISPADHSVVLAGRETNTLSPISTVATAGQTIFPLGAVVSPGACLVFQNGAKLSGTEYGLTTTTLTLAAAASADDVVTVIAIGTFEVANALTPAANLADLGSAVSARTNLGLGTAALESVGTGAGQIPTLDADARQRLSTAPSGSIIGHAYAMYTSQIAHTAVIPADTTIPQITEGDEILSLTYTPKIVGSKLLVRFQGMTCNDSTGYGVSAAMFLNGAANAVDAVFCYQYQPSSPYMIGMEIELTPSGLTPQTISIRIGPQSGAQRMNAGGTAITLGGVPKTTLIVEEIAP